MRHGAGTVRESLDLRLQTRRFRAPADIGGVLPKQHRSQTALGCTGRPTLSEIGCVVCVATSIWLTSHRFRRSSPAGATEKASTTVGRGSRSRSRHSEGAPALR